MELEFPPVRAPDQEVARVPPLQARSETLDWISHRDTIMRLYITENKSLPETQRMMEQIYSFKAS